MMGSRCAGIAAVLVVMSASASSAALVCHSSGSYFVVVRERTQAVGTDFLARKLPADKTPACAFKKQVGDLVLTDSNDAFYYKDLRGRHLVLTASTGPMQDLVIFDVGTRKTLLKVTAGDDLEVDADGIRLWARTGDATAKTCRSFAELKKDGLLPVTETKARFVFADDTLVKEKQTRCVGAQ